MHVSENIILSILICFLTIIYLPIYKGLFNLRGQDQKNTPFFTSYALISPNENILFTSIPVTDAVKTHVTDEKTELIYKTYEELNKEIVRVMKSSEEKVLVPLTANTAIYKLIPSNRLVHDYSPIEAMKSVKNDIEATGMVKASQRDSVAIVRFLAWLEANVNSTKITEITASEKLLELRS